MQLPLEPYWFPACRSSLAPAYILRKKTQSSWVIPPLPKWNWSTFCQLHYCPTISDHFWWLPQLSQSALGMLSSGNQPFSPSVGGGREEKSPWENLALLLGFGALSAQRRAGLSCPAFLTGFLGLKVQRLCPGSRSWCEICHTPAGLFG